MSRLDLSLTKIFRMSSLFFIFWLACIIPFVNGQSDSLVVVVNLDGVISVASNESIAESLELAEQLDASVVIVILDTPGGAWEATQDIIRLIEGSSIPIISYVYPRGATAWSAGTYIVVSSHVAAMAPFSIVGSCQPRIFPSGEVVEDEKTLNAFSEYIVQRARMHGRNETIAEDCVRNNRNLGADEALDLNFIEYVSPNLEELLIAIDGQSVETLIGEVTLITSGASITNYSPSVRVRVLKLISDPTIAYVLFILGVYGIIFGFSVAGFEGEIIGAISLILGLIGLGFYVDLLILILLLMGGVFIYLEIRDPAAEIFGPAGIFCLVLGSLLMLRLDPEQWLVSPEWYRLFLITAILLVAIISAISIFILYKIILATKKESKTLSFIGEKAITIDEIKPDQDGFVRYHGELWRARSKFIIKPGVPVKITRKENLVLIVEPES